MNFESFVLAAATDTLADASAPAVREHADAVEFRLDLADDPLTALRSYDGPLPIIATNRADWEGGASGGPDRLDTLERAIEVEPVAAVDVELAAIRRGTARSLLERASERGVAVIASVHDFEATPSERAMERLLARASEHADVAKLAVTPDAPADTLALLSATARATERGLSVATMAMGQLGAHTRVVAPIYGSTIGYAPVDAERATAPGQLPVAELAGLYERLCSERGN
ncbi:type I 3-dehydroquinate dehydratase [Halovivax limisalsi]|uniref:type I 3-dehydroquinate dehydratase n=1 Tax=Halovivax limisalsi TaxID=1453760 RepID=UPI001FFDA281|nr:type I 3-dehydroquinate dehydratase [Halovivax limisalsi]